MLHRGGKGLRGLGALCSLRRMGAMLGWLLAALPAWAVPSDYTIGAGDMLRISVFQNPDLSLETRVAESGTISYPLLGAVRVGGLTAAQAEMAIADGLRERDFVKQPQVNVLLMQVRGNQVSALGLVNRPGRYPLDQSVMHLSELLALAGGVAPGGADTATLSGQRDGKPWRVEVDVPALLSRGGEDPVLVPGDTLYVDRAPTVYIYGEVQRPGQLRLDRDMNVMQALAAGGGLTLRGTERGLRVHRRSADGKVQVLEPSLDERLRDGDVIQVRESLF